MEGVEFITGGSGTSYSGVKRNDEGKKEEATEE
jgi:hypothetical protein